MANTPMVHDMYDAVHIDAPIELTDFLDIRNVRRDVDQMIAHDGPECHVRALEHDEAAEGLQAVTPWAARKR